MPAIMQLGRVTSGRGFMTGGCAASDIPSAAFAKDLPQHMRVQLEALGYNSRESAAEAAAYQPQHQPQVLSRSLEALYQQARYPAPSQLLGQNWLPQHQQSVPQQGQHVPQQAQHAPEQAQLFPSLSGAYDECEASV